MLKTVLLTLAVTLAQTVFPNAQADDQIDQLVTELEATYQIKVHFKSLPNLSWPIGHRLADSSDEPALRSYLQLLSEELHSYSSAYIAKTQLKSLVLVKDLSYRGQFRTGMPDRYQGALILDFKRGNHAPSYQRHVIHHEYYHLIEATINGSTYWRDPRWAAFNLNEFRYGNGGASAQNSSNMYAFSNPSPGFVNRYSMSAMEEDKAEVYAALFVRSERAQMLAIGERDPILRHKIEYMIAFVSTLDVAMAQSSPLFGRAVRLGG